MNYWQQISGNPFFTVALPILGGMFITGWWQNRRIDDLKDAMNERFREILARLEKIEERLSAVERKVDALEIKAWR